MSEKWVIELNKRGLSYVLWNLGVPAPRIAQDTGAMDFIYQEKIANRNALQHQNDFFFDKEINQRINAFNKSSTCVCIGNMHTISGRETDTSPVLSCIRKNTMNSALDSDSASFNFKQCRMVVLTIAIIKDVDKDVNDWFD